MEEKKVKTTAEKSTEMSKRVRMMIKGMAQKAHEASAKGQPIAYLFVASFYDEILRAMDIIPVGTENFAGLCAAKMDAERFLDKAESEGYARHLCTYATCGIGFDAIRHELGTQPPNAADGGLPMPTVMLGSGMMLCDPRYKWYQAAQRYNDVPVNVHNFLWPPVDANLKEVEGYYVKYLRDELQGLVDFLEKQTGRKMDWDRLSQVLDISDKTLRVWHAAYQLRKAIPAPMPTQDALNTMVPGYFLMGTQEALDFYEELYKEVKYRVDNKIGVIPDEKYRLMWGAGLPPWFSLMIFNYFESKGAVFAIETAYPPFPIVEVPRNVHPLERLATRALKQCTYRHEKAQKHSGLTHVEWLLELINDYKVDGVVCHRATTCRTVHVGQIHMLNVLKQYTDVPTLILESDIVDVRAYSEADTHARIDAFIETVDAYKKKKTA